MHKDVKGPMVRGPSEGPTVESVFCFPIQNVVKSTKIYTFSTRTHSTVVSALKEAE